METSFEQKNPNLGTLSITVQTADYMDEADKQLKKIAKTVAIKGFRPGKAPLPLVNKMMGNNVKEDSVVNLMQKAIREFVTDSKVNFLFSPIPTGDIITKEKIDAQEPFTFSFDFFISPKIDCEDLLDKIKLFDYEIVTTDSDFENFKTNFIKYANTYTDTYQIIENSYFQADVSFNETTKRQWFSLDRDIKSEYHHLFLDKKQADTIETSLPPILVEENIPLLFGEGTVLSDSVAKFEILRVQKLDTPTGNELYQALFPEENVENEEQFEKLIESEFSKHLSRRTQYLRKLKFERDLLDTYPINLDQDIFMRFYSYARTEENESMDIDPSKIPSLQKGIALSLIAEAIEKQFNVGITFDEVVDFEAITLVQRYGNLGIDFSNMRSYVIKMFKEDEGKFSSAKNQLIMIKAPEALPLQRIPVQISMQELEHLQEELKK